MGKDKRDLIENKDPRFRAIVPRFTKYYIVQNPLFPTIYFNVRSCWKPRIKPVTQARFPSLSRKPGPPGIGPFRQKVQCVQYPQPIVYCLHIGHRLHLGAHWIHTLWHLNFMVSSPKLTVLIARVWYSSALRQHGQLGSFSICCSMVARFCAINSSLVFFESFSKKADFSISRASGIDSSVVLLTASE